MSGITYIVGVALHGLVHDASASAVGGFDREVLESECELHGHMVS